MSPATHRDPPTVALFAGTIVRNPLRVLRNGDGSDVLRERLENVQVVSDPELVWDTSTYITPAEYVVPFLIVVTGATRLCATAV